MLWPFIFLFIFYLEIFKKNHKRFFDYCAKFEKKMVTFFVLKFLGAPINLYQLLITISVNTYKFVHLKLFVFEQFNSIFIEKFNLIQKRKKKCSCSSRKCSCTKYYSNIFEKKFHFYWISSKKFGEIVENG